MSIRAGIIGGAGYTGGELLRLLLRHPQANISFIHSRSQAGKPVVSVHQDLFGETDLLFTDDLLLDKVDVLFLCLGHGESRAFLQKHTLPAHVRLIDLTNDFRLDNEGVRPSYGGTPFVYGLPEWTREDIRHAKHIANPGCFATALQLGLLPLAQAGLLREVYTTGITGSTGAGQSLSPTSHFSWRENNIQAYKTLTHQHVPEVEQTLRSLNGKNHLRIHFVPWRGDFTRGIFVSSQLTLELSLSSVEELYRKYYLTHPFTHITREAIFLKQVINTNKCLIQIEESGGQFVIHSAIDNLLKGASGQALQNMNLMMGLEETTGLQLKPSSF